MKNRGEAKLTPGTGRSNQRLINRPGFTTQPKLRTVHTGQNGHVQRRIRTSPLNKLPNIIINIKNFKSSRNVTVARTGMAVSANKVHIHGQIRKSGFMLSFRRVHVLCSLLTGKPKRRERNRQRDRK